MSEEEVKRRPFPYRGSRGAKARLVSRSTFRPVENQKFLSSLDLLVLLDQAKSTETKIIIG